MTRVTRAEAAKSTGKKPSGSFGTHKSSATHIMAAPKGPRTVSHQRIKKAIEKVFRERLSADA